MGLFSVFLCGVLIIEDSIKFAGMADEILHLWKDFSLSEAESLEVEVPDIGIGNITPRGSSCLVGKLLADRIIGKDTIKSMVVRGWQPSGTMVFKNLGNNLFLMEFEHVWDKARVLEGRPWVFEGHLFSVNNFNGSVVPGSMEFDLVSFWVRIFHLPLGFMCETMGFQLGTLWEEWKRLRWMLMELGGVSI